MKLSTKIKKNVSPLALWKPDGSYGSDVIDTGYQIIFMLDHKRVYATTSFTDADAKDNELKASGASLLPLAECPVVNSNNEIIMHYTSTTYKDWCNM